MDTYTHKPIDLSKKAIRLLRLCGADREDAINCELFQSFLEEDQDVHVEYEALSYTWSDTVDGDHRLDEAPGPRCIFIEGLPFQVTKNLYLALKHLRLRDSDRILWVDAICINQGKDENEEKNHQVGQMNIVYSSAENVIIWLGPGSPAINWLFYASTELHRRAVRRCPVKGQTPLERWKAVWRSLDQQSEGNALLVTEDSYNALETVLRRPWFGRVWVIQEVALAKRATVMCGRSSTPTSSFALMPSLLRVEVPELTQAVLDVMPGPLRNEESSWWNEKRDLLTVLQKFGSCASSKAHDRIYALLGISSDPHAIKPKYEAAEQEAVRDVLKFTVSEHGNLPEHVNFPEWSVDELITNLRPSEHMEGEDLDQRLLLWAVRNHEMDLAGHLLKMQSQFFIPLGTERPPQPILHLLAETPGSQSLVDAFARRNGMYLDFNCCFGSPEETALQCALRNGNLEVADVLLKAQDSALNQLESHSIRGYRDLDLASASRSTEPLLSSSSAKDPAFGRLRRDAMMYLETAARDGRTSYLEFILDRMRAASPPSTMALCLAIESGSKSAVELLIQHGANVNDSSGLWIPLNLAVERNDMAIVGLLLDHGADPNRGFPLYSAVKTKNTQMAALILEYKDRKNPVMSTDGAAENGTTDGKDASAAANANMDLAHHHDTKALEGALRRAIESGDEQMILLLLRHQWSVEGPNLWVAASRGYTSAAMAILNRPPLGFDVNGGSRISHTTPLFKAANRGDEDLVRALLERGADMEITDCGGATALWAASNKGRLNCVRILLEAGADTKILVQPFQGFDYTTPLKIAQYRGFYEVATLISSYIEARKAKRDAARGLSVPLDTPAMAVDLPSLPGELRNSGQANP
ncbi:hypothetical protein RB595_003611 [Gaeumannomyces hyphopodioides]